MDIIFKGKHTGEELVASLLSVVRLFKDRYNVPEFREIHLSVTLLDKTGKDVELVDNKSSSVYRVFEVYRENSELRGEDTADERAKPKLVVDNTHHPMRKP